MISDRNREIIKRQRDLSCQLMEEIAKHWAETDRERYQTEYLETKTEEQQKYIDRLTAEKHDQNVLIKALTLKIENGAEKLEREKNEIAQEKLQLQKIQAEISEERETMDRRRNKIIIEQLKLQMIKYNNTRQEYKEPKEIMEEHKHEIIDNLLSAITKNNKIVFEAKQATEQSERLIENIKKEIQNSKKDILQQRAKIDQMKHYMNFNNIKQMWMKVQRYNEIQKASGSKLDKKESQKRGAHYSDKVKIKICRIHKEMVKLWDLLGSEQEVEVKQESSPMKNMISDFQKECKDTETEVKADTEKQKQELVKKLEITTKKRKIEMTNTDTEINKQDSIGKIKRKKKRISKQKKETELDKQTMEERQGKNEVQISEQKEEIQEVDKIRAITHNMKYQFEKDGMEMSTTNKVKADMQRVIFEIQEIRTMLHEVREDTEKTKRIFIDEKSQSKWRNFQEKKNRWKLQQLQEKTLIERDKLEIMKIKMQRQRDEAEQKMEDAITAILAIGKMKANIEKAATEMNNTQQEMLKAKKELEKNKKEVRTYMDKLTTMKAHMKILAEPDIQKTFSVKLKSDRESVNTQTQADEKKAEGEITKEALFLHQSITMEDQCQTGEVKKQEQRQSEGSTMGIYEKQSIFLQLPPEMLEEMIVDEDQTELVINFRQKLGLKRQISKLKAREEKIREQIKYTMQNVEKKNQEVKRLIMEINDLQSRPDTETDLQI
ncbi:myosin-6-like isoform X2 [Echeneis naucrates]|nr:myosin-6-like isoform X2 [Echeneis naucrates]